MDTRGTRSEIETLKLKVRQGIIHVLRKLSPHGVGVEHWPYNPRDSVRSPALATLKIHGITHSLCSDGQAVRANVGPQ